MRQAYLLEKYEFTIDKIIYKNRTREDNIIIYSILMILFYEKLSLFDFKISI